MNEHIHQPVIARGDHHQIIPMVFHGLQERVDGLLTKIVAGTAVQRIGLVDEQHAAQSLLHRLAGLDGRLSHVARHKPAAVHLHKLALGENAQAVIDPGHQTGDGGLAGAWIPGKDHVQGELRHWQSVFLPHFMDRGQIDQVLDFLLYGFQPHIAFQFRL